MAASEARTVIVATDASKQSEEALNYYLTDLHQANNKVILLHSPELHNVDMRMSKSDRPPYEEWNRIYQESQDKWKVLQQKCEDKIKENNVNGEFKVEIMGKPGEAIVKAAADANASYIVIGSRGLGSIRRTIMGSVSDYVVHHSHCPVIVCKK